MKAKKTRHLSSEILRKKSFAQKCVYYVGTVKLWQNERVAIDVDKTNQCAYEH